MRGSLGGAAATAADYRTPPAGRISVVMYRAVTVSLSSYRKSNRCHSVARPLVLTGGLGARMPKVFLGLDAECVAAEMIAFRIAQRTIDRFLFVGRHVVHRWW